jgi:hypothetical protein
MGKDSSVSKRSFVAGVLAFLAIHYLDYVIHNFKYSFMDMDTVASSLNTIHAKETVFFNKSCSHFPKVLLNFVNDTGDYL